MLWYLGPTWRGFWNGVASTKPPMGWVAGRLDNEDKHGFNSRRRTFFKPVLCVRCQSPLTHSKPEAKEASFKFILLNSPTFNHLPLFELTKLNEPVMVALPPSGASKFKP